MGGSKSACRSRSVRTSTDTLVSPTQPPAPVISLAPHRAPLIEWVLVPRTKPVGGELQFDFAMRAPNYKRNTGHAGARLEELTFYDGLSPMRDADASQNFMLGPAPA